MGCGSSSYTSPPGGVDADNGTDGTSSDRHTNTVGRDSPVTRPGEERRNIATRYRHPISDNSSANIGPTPKPAHLGDNAIYDDEFCNNDDKGKEAGQRGKKNVDHVSDDGDHNPANENGKNKQRSEIADKEKFGTFCITWRLLFTSLDQQVSLKILIPLIIFSAISVFK